MTRLQCGNGGLRHYIALCAVSLTMSGTVGANAIWAQEYNALSVAGIKSLIDQQRSAIRSLLVTYELKLKFDPVLKEKNHPGFLWVEA